MAHQDENKEHAIQAAIAGAVSSGSVNIVDGYSENGMYFVVTASPDGSYTLEEDDAPTSI
jgi:hypothetical protein